jgi:hypothetical protein
MDHTYCDSALAEARERIWQLEVALGQLYVTHGCTTAETCNACSQARAVLNAPIRWINALTGGENTGK